MHRHHRLEPFTLAGVITLLTGMLLLRLPLRAPSSTGFFLVIGLILLGNVYWWAWVDARLFPPVAPRVGRGFWLRVVWAGYILFMLSPMALFVLFGRRTWDALPIPLLMWTMGWHMLLACGVSVIALFTVARSLLARIRNCKPKTQGLEPLGLTMPTPDQIPRRTFLLRTAAAAPIVLTSAGVAAGLSQVGKFRINRITMRLPRLPERLRGLTITHLSDTHVGRLFRPDHLPAMVEAANKLNSDLVMFTGDLIDHSNDFLAPACDAIAQLQHRYGRLMVVGNHDLLDDAGAFYNYITARVPMFLVNRHVRLNISGEPIQVAGLFYSRMDHDKYADAALSGADNNIFTIGLAHHPHAFDPLADRGVDLTLAGHTHGGQMMLTPPGSPFPIGAGNLFFRYIWGQYHRGNSAMYVNAGIGNWFPYRINAPAEIVQIQLI